MISPSTLTFLRKLAKNNNREWFHAHKETYKEVAEEWNEFLHQLATEIAKFDPEIKKTLFDKQTVKPFRIYRDIRFSKDKTPYNEHLSGYIVPGGKEQLFAGYYIQLKPGATFAGGGLHMPPAPALKRIRKSFEKNDQPFRAIMKKASFKKIYKELENFDPVKTAPKGFDKDHPAIDLIRHKSFFVTHQYTNKEVTDKHFVSLLGKHLRLVHPFNVYLTKAAK